MDHHQKGHRVEISLEHSTLCVSYWCTSYTGNTWSWSLSCTKRTIFEISLTPWHFSHHFWAVHHVTDGTVVEELDFGPFHPLSLVNLLLLLQYQLHKQLLHLLVAVVDAELLKAMRDEIYITVNNFENGLVWNSTCFARRLQSHRCQAHWWQWWRLHLEGWLPSEHWYDSPAS